MDIGEYPFDLLVAGNSGGRPVELVLQMLPTPTRIAERPAYPPGKYCKEPWSEWKRQEIQKINQPQSTQVAKQRHCGRVSSIGYPLQ